MPAYFKPLRRKIGVLTLMMACVFMAGWLRSMQTADQRFFQNGMTSIEYFQSYQGAVGWMHLNANSDSEKSLFEKCLPPPFFTSSAYPFLTDRKQEGGHIYYGFAFSRVTSNEATGFLWTIPYWSITVPLAMISSGLLVLKPGQLKLVSQSVALVGSSILHELFKTRRRQLVLMTFCTGFIVATSVIIIACWWIVIRVEQETGF